MDFDNLLYYVIEKATAGKKVKVNLKNKDLIVEGKKWIDAGKITSLAPTKKIHRYNNVMDMIEYLYSLYKISYPDEKEAKYTHGYFKALNADEMTIQQIIKGGDRYVYRIKLEAAVLCQVIIGNLKWKEEWGSWYYQGKDEDFIILREWID